MRFLFLAFREIRNHFLAQRDRRAAAKSLVAELSRGWAAGVRLFRAARRPPLVHGPERYVFRFGRTLSVPEHSMHGNRMPPCHFISLIFLRRCDAVVVC